jgi:hypothetical protein
LPGADHHDQQDPEAVGATPPAGVCVGGRTVCSSTATPTNAPTATPSTAVMASPRFS